jgi:hypothetical protein
MKTVVRHLALNQIDTFEEYENAELQVELISLRKFGKKSKILGEWTSYMTYRKMFLK